MSDSLIAVNIENLNAEEIFSHLPANRVGKIDRLYVQEVLDDGFGNTKDPANISCRFESAFAQKFGVGYAISHNSGSGTMLSCLLAAGVGPGDEVIVPTLTAAPTAFVVVECGAVPVFADSNADTFCIDPKDIERRLTEHTRAIIPVSIYGLSPDYDSIMKTAERYRLTVIEDNAQCFLGAYKGRRVGAIGQAASFSFQGSKHMTSGGDGGMVITNDEEYARDIRKHCSQGFRTLTGRAGNTVIPRDTRQDWSFERHDRLGYNFHMSPMQAALGLAQLQRLEFLVAARRYIASQYESVIRDEKCEWLIAPYVPGDSVHVFWSYTCKLNEKLLGVSWQEFRRTFIQNGGDGLYGAWRPVHLEPIFQTMAFYGSSDRAPNFDPRYKGKVKSYKEGDCPVIEKLQRCLCQFKTSMQTLDKVNRQADALRKTIRYYA
ncbi:MAG: DegT/DnrJ/EryC1/StrS family aminotransferase [Terriglobia bacterium]